MSGINRYYEDLVFDSGTKINVSRQVNNEYFNTMHWHPYVELLVSRCDGNKAEINFTSLQLNKKDIALIWSGDLHAVQTVREDSCLIIQFPIALLAVMGELNGILPRLSRLHCVRFNPNDPESLEIIRCAEAVDRHHFGSDPFREVQVYADLLNLFVLKAQGIEVRGHIHQIIIIKTVLPVYRQRRTDSRQVDVKAEFLPGFPLRGRPAAVSGDG